MSESQNFKGTPRALLPITEQVLAFVARYRARGGIDLNDLRRIELCALATREACYFHDLYGSGDGGRSGRSGRIVHRDPADDSGFYVPPCQET